MTGRGINHYYNFIASQSVRSSQGSAFGIELKFKLIEVIHRRRCHMCALLRPLRLLAYWSPAHISIE